MPPAFAPEDDDAALADDSDASNDDDEAAAAAEAEDMEAKTDEANVVSKIEVRHRVTR